MKIIKLENKELWEEVSKFPEELKKDISSVKKYKIQYEKLIFDQYSLKYIRPTNFDDILEQYIAKYNEPDYIPYWAEFWPSGAYMAKNLCLRYNFSDDSVIELGSGTGISGLSVPLKNGDITYSDYDPNAFPFIKINHYLNYKYVPKIEKLDWTNNNFQNKYKWIIASDLAYERRLFKPLISTMENILEENGKIILTEPEREFAKPFFTILEEKGFTFIKKIIDGKNINQNIKIGLYEIFKSN